MPLIRNRAVHTLTELKNIQGRPSRRSVVVDDSVASSVPHVRARVQVGRDHVIVSRWLTSNLPSGTFSTHPLFHFRR